MTAPKTPYESRCPACSTVLPRKFIRSEANRHAAKAERPGMRDKPSRNPYGRAGKPKEGEGAG